MPSQARDPGVEELSGDIIDEILIASGLPAHGWLRKRQGLLSASYS
jgi:hypothetical protein